MLADQFILSLDNVELTNKNLLPEYSGIYYVVDEQQVVWYIGRSINLRARWNNEKPHHRYSQLLSIANQENKQFFIYYYQVHKNKLNQQEKQQIAKYEPRLNYTPVIKNKDQYSESDRILYGYQDNSNNIFSLKILSHNRDSENITILGRDSEFYIFNNPQYMIEETRQIQVAEIEALETNGLKQFTRKFISLRDDEIGLNLQLEICFDSEGRLFVRHYTLFIIYGWKIEIIDDINNEKIISNYLSTLKSKCYELYYSSLKWLGYKLSCENILLIDEQEQFKIETIAIMLPYHMFIDLVEQLWIKTSNLPEILEKQETSWFKNQNLPLKIAKHLDKNNLTLIELLEEL
ncbi:MAG: hypothetical protein Tsb0014_01260 [Pleurocapsa sp.]